MTLRTCVDPSGRFVFGIHKPRYRVKNLRKDDLITTIGRLDQGEDIDNRANFPPGDIDIPAADAVYEIPNPFPFKGATFIPKSSADRSADRLETIHLPEMPHVSMTSALKQLFPDSIQKTDDCFTVFEKLPEPVLFALATTSSDPIDLVAMAENCCTFIHDESSGKPVGMAYTVRPDGRRLPVIRNMALFKAVANNPNLPDDYKDVMVLKPGAQGHSEITADWSEEAGGTHVFEYLRANSYIAWGHYAANMANDAIRYRAGDLRLADIGRMRHLYYQRTYVRLAEELGLHLPGKRNPLSDAELESLRLRIRKALLETKNPLSFTGTLWGWNFGFDYSPTQYRLHGSHQQVHQQYALIPAEISQGTAANGNEDNLPAYGCGDLVADFVRQYRSESGTNFFDAYIQAVRGNARTDGRTDLPASLVVYEDEQVMLFVPKAQTSQWELQLLCRQPVGNILEADTATRNSLNRAMLVAIRVLTGLGARMVTAIEYPKRFGFKDDDQRLLYCFLPKLPYSPGSFTEAQLRWINNHYPEDFARACRQKIPDAAGD